MSQTLAASPPVTQRFAAPPVSPRAATPVAAAPAPLLGAPAGYPSTFISPRSILQLPPGTVCFRSPQTFLAAPPAYRQALPVPAPAPAVLCRHGAGPAVLPAANPACYQAPSVPPTTTIVPHAMPHGRIICQPQPTTAPQPQLVFATAAHAQVSAVPTAYPVVCGTAAPGCPLPLTHCPACHLPLPPSTSLPPGASLPPPSQSLAALHSVLPAEEPQLESPAAEPEVEDQQQLQKYLLIPNQPFAFGLPVQDPFALTPDAAPPSTPSPFTPVLGAPQLSPALPYPVYLPPFSPGGNVSPRPGLGLPSATEVAGIPLQFHAEPFLQPEAGESPRGLVVDTGDVSGQFQVFGAFSAPESFPASPTTVPEAKLFDKATSVSGMDLLKQRQLVVDTPEAEEEAPVKPPVLVEIPLHRPSEPLEETVFKLPDTVQDPPAVPTAAFDAGPALTPEKGRQGSFGVPQAVTEPPTVIEPEIPITPIKPAELFVDETPISPAAKAAQEIAVVVASNAAESPPAAATASPSAASPASTVDVTTPATKTRKRVVKRVVRVSGTAKLSPKRSPKRSPKPVPKPAARVAVTVRRQVVRVSPPKQRVVGASTVTQTPLFGVDVHIQQRRIVQDGNPVQDQFLCARAVVPDGPFHQAGIRAGDVIVAWEAQRLTSRQQWVDKVAHVKTGDVVRLTVFTGEDCQEVPVVVGASGRVGRYAAPPAPSPAAAKPKPKAAAKKTAAEVPAGDDAIQGW